MVDHAQQGPDVEPTIAGPRALVLRRLEGGADDPLEGLAAGANLAPLRIGLDHVALLLEDEHVVPVLDDMGHPHPDEGAQALARRFLAHAHRARLGQEGLGELVTDGHEQLLLAAEVVIQRAGGQTHGGGQILHRRLVVALARENGGRGRDHGLPATVVALLEGGTSRTTRHCKLYKPVVKPCLNRRSEFRPEM